jgi:hypothetical protein
MQYLQVFQANTLLPKCDKAQLGVVGSFVGVVEHEQSVRKNFPRVAIIDGAAVGLGLNVDGTINEGAVHPNG